MWYAVELEGRPLAVFPCRNKKPCCPGGHLAATADPEKRAALFRAYPTAPSVGVATGVVGGIDCLDADPRNGGDDWFQQNKDRIPQTRTHQTPSGGLHLIFRHAPGLRCSSGRIARGIDVKADAGYIIWHPAQSYPVLCKAPVADWPEWLLALARGPSASPTRGDGPLIRWSPPRNDYEIPRPLYLKVCRLTRGVRGTDKRRVIGLLRDMVVQKSENQNDWLNIAAFCFREIISSDIVTSTDAEGLLLDAATISGYVARDGFDAALRTIRSGLGLQNINGPSPTEEAAP
jgi:Bifunctional DNA primase/polymerase, N-terminal